MSFRLEIPAAQAIVPMRTATPVHAIGRFGAQQSPTRISSGVMAGQIVSKVNPVYPQEAKERGIQGAVVLHVIIGKDGTVQDLAVISGPEQLQASAIEAVRQWVYKPYLLNGEPQEVDTTITVNYSLGNSAQPSNNP
jgi:protein TonB